MSRLGVCLLVLAYACASVVAQPQTLGDWEPELDESAWGMRAIHSILLRNGWVLCLDAPEEPPLPENRNVMLFNPSTGEVRNELSTPPVPQQPRAQGLQWDLHCSGHSTTASGHVIIVGGGGSPPGLPFTFDYDPDQPYQSWGDRRLSDDNLPPEPNDPFEITVARWYATCTTLANGKILVGGGRAEIPTCNIGAEQNRMITFDITRPAGSRYEYAESGAPSRDLVWYPFMFLLKNGDVAFCGGDELGLCLSDPPPAQTSYFKTSLGAWLDGPAYPLHGTSAAMYRPDAIIKISRGSRDTTYVPSECSQNPVMTSWKLDLAQQTPAWQFVACSAHNRSHGGQLVVLPDGRVLAVGGSGTTPEMIDPDAQLASWVSLAQYGTQRAYHSSAVLLPDARVLLAGGENPDPITTAQIFRPPYLFDASGDPLTTQRPVIALPSINTEIKYGDGFEIVLGGNYADEIEQVVLMRPGAATHGYDQDARRVPLEFVLTGANKLKAAAPAHGNIAPPGYYMLFVLRLGDRAGIFHPSVATWVKLK